MTNPIRVCSFESRRRNEMETLIQKFGGIATVAPTMQEAPLDSHSDAFAFADALLVGKVDVLILMTGVGTTALLEALSSKYAMDELLEALSKCTLIARGPKPVVAAKKFGLKVDHRAAEPNTWKEVTELFDQNSISMTGKTIAIQEYGAPSHELYYWLQDNSAVVMPVPIYKWELPDDIGPMQSAIRDTIAGEFDLLLWTSAQQAVHMTEVAKELGTLNEWIEAVNRCCVASIGPTATARLSELKLRVDLEPSHPKMAHLVREGIEFARQLMTDS